MKSFIIHICRARRHCEKCLDRTQAGDLWRQEMASTHHNIPKGWVCPYGLDRKQEIVEPVKTVEYTSVHGKYAILGNAPIPSERIDRYIADGYKLVLFNYTRHYAYLPLCHIHYLRPDKSSGSHFGGQEMIEEHDGKVILISGTGNAERIKERIADTGRDVVHFNQILDGYPQGFVASTGFIAIHQLLKPENDIIVDGFTWEGVKAHDWEYERVQCLSLWERGLIDIAGMERRKHVRTAHFVWIDYSGDGNDYEMPFNHYVSVSTFLAHHPGYKVMLWTNGKPRGALWKRIRDSVSVQSVDSSLTEHMLSTRGIHRSDYVKYHALHMYGGIYLDISGASGGR